MQKTDDSPTFNRDWNDFKVGFGNISGDYWLGNDQIHQLTKDDGYKVRVDIQAEVSTGQSAWYWAEYSTFIVGDESTNYQLLLDGYSGDAGDPLEYLNGTQFSTYDVDNDSGPDHCAVDYQGGFWHAAGCVWCGLTSAANYFYSDGLENNLQTAQMWLECK